MSHELALAEERAGRIAQAADAYEVELSRAVPTLAALMNAVVLYWQSTDYGFSTANGLSAEFVDRAAERFRGWLTKALALYPNAGEPRFWRKYIAWADLGETLSVDECKELLSSDPTTLVPAMHIFAVSRGEDCANEAARLLEECQREPTVRAKYIASVLQGVLHRRNVGARH
jgi:hypothetical protein